MNYQFLFPNKIILENDSSLRLGEIIKDKFEYPLIITGSKSIYQSSIYKNITSSLSKNKIPFKEYPGISHEPDPETVDLVAEFAQSHNVKSIIAIGGGSVIDTGKAAAALATNQKGVENYLEGVGKGYTVQRPPLPFVAVPTTAGTGAEATKNAVISSFEKKYKKSFRAESLIANLIIIDPKLTVSMPAHITAYSGMDAICQLIESYVSIKHNILSQALCAYFIPRALKAIIQVYEQPDNIDARSMMCHASLVSGIALANSGLGAVHGFASGLGGMYPIPHGLICAVLLPGICEVNSQKAPDKFKDLANLINRNHSNDIERMVLNLKELNKKLNIKTHFQDYQIEKKDIPEIVKRSQGSSMKGNPVPFSEKEWEDFFSRYI